MLESAIPQQAVANVKTKLVSVKCPHVESSEGLDQLSSLLFRPSEDRSNLLSWVASQLLNTREKAALVEHLKVPFNFINGDLGPEQQAKTWTHLADLVEVKYKHDRNPDAGKMEAWAKEYQEALLTSGLPLAGGGRSLRLIPRDLEPYVDLERAKVRGRQDLSDLLDQVTKTLDELAATEGEDQTTRALPEVEPHSQGDLINKLRHVTGNFKGGYKTDLQAWVERVPARVKEGSDLDLLANEAVTMMGTVNQNAETNETLRKSITRIKANL